MRFLCIASALAAIGCVGTPTPLAPALSGSIGVPHSGVQTTAVELPKKGPGFVRYRSMSPFYWGHPRLVRAIENAALVVDRERPGGAPLYVGDLSARNGGKIPGHRSHRTGRDADLLLYVTTPGGAPIASPGFVAVETDGLAKVTGAKTPEDEFVRLDVERQWLLFRTLMTSEDALVQFLFVSRSIEALVIDHAQALGEPLELIWRAETVLLQPGDSSPHDDHVHIRIACAPDEAVAGCEGGGPYWEWLPALPALAPLGGLDLQSLAVDDPLDVAEALSAGTEADPGGV
jgi:penicillin-insensitive murein DD-endopeptidase